MPHLRNVCACIVVALASVAPRAARADICENVWCPPGYGCDPDSGSSVCAALKTTTSAAPLVVDAACGGACPEGYVCQGTTCAWIIAVPTVDTGSDVRLPTTPRITTTTAYVWTPPVKEDGGKSNINLYIGLGAGVLILCCLGWLLAVTMVFNKGEKEPKGKKAKAHIGWEEQQVLDHDWGLEGGIAIKIGGPQRASEEQWSAADWVVHEQCEHHTDHSKPDHAGPLHRRMDYHSEQAGESEHSKKRAHHHEHARKTCREGGPPAFHGQEGDIPEYATHGHAYDTLKQREKVTGHVVDQVGLGPSRQKEGKSPGHSPGRSPRHKRSPGREGHSPGSTSREGRSPGREGRSPGREGRSPGREASPRSPGRRGGGSSGARQSHEEHHHGEHHHGHHHH